MAWATLCDLSELSAGRGYPVEIDGYRLAVFMHADRPYAIADACPHAGAPMAGGWIDGDCVVCPRHMWQFNLSDGKLPGGAEGLRTFATRVITFDGRQIVQADLKMP